MKQDDFETIDFRQATETDAADVSAVYLESRKTFVPFAPLAHSDSEVRGWIAGVLIPTGNVEVVLVEGKIAGMCAAVQRHPVSWIDHLYLRPGYVGKGLGAKLLDRALKKLSRPVRLYTFQENKGACRFYERYGFVPIEYGDGSGNEEGVPDVLYELIGS